jgi:hypothetical protein
VFTSATVPTSASSAELYSNQGALETISSSNVVEGLGASLTGTKAVTAPQQTTDRKFVSVLSTSSAGLVTAWTSPIINSSVLTAIGLDLFVMMRPSPGVGPESIMATCAASVVGNVWYGLGDCCIGAAAGPIALGMGCGSLMQVTSTGSGISQQLVLQVDPVSSTYYDWQISITEHIE